jgi:FAD/FMN-containing dehydrogenase
MLVLDREARTLRVESGAMIKEMEEFLVRNDFCFPTIPVIDRITAAGTIQNACHGTGIFFFVLLLFFKRNISFLFFKKKKL